MTASSGVDEKIVECVEEGLEALGGNVKHVTYYYVEKKFQLTKTEIPEKPEVFKHAITSIFGQEGAKTIEELIVRKIIEVFNLRRGSKQTFTDIVSRVRTRFRK